MPARRWPLLQPHRDGHQDCGHLLHHHVADWCKRQDGQAAFQHGRYRLAPDSHHIIPELLDLSVIVPLLEPASRAGAHQAAGRSKTPDGRTDSRWWDLQRPIGVHPVFQPDVPPRLAFDVLDQRLGSVPDDGVGLARAVERSESITVTRLGPASGEAQVG